MRRHVITVDDPGDERLDDYRALNDQPYRRRYEGDRTFIAEGFVAIDRLIESGHTVRSVLVAEGRIDRFDAAALERGGVPVYVAPRDVISAVVGFDLHRGIVASAARRPHPTLEAITAGGRRLAVLEGLNDPENVGAIARAARAFGIDGLVLDPTCTDPYSRRTVRVSMGEVLMVPIVRSTAETWMNLIDQLHGSGFETWAMTPGADADDLWQIPVPDRLAVFLGAEGPGLGPAVLRRADRRVRIPIAAAVDSLNVGQAAAITFAAVTRARAPGLR
jgi:tRNA G18 (ribose-2'-O)-methylase SpoU